MTSIEIDVEETTLVIIDMDDPLNVTSVLQRSFVYAPRTAVKADQATMYQINIDSNSSFESACLVVGVHKDGRLKTPLQGTFNGKPFRADAEWTGDMRNLLAPVSIQLETDQLREQNIIELRANPGLTVASVQLQMVAKRPVGVRDENQAAGNTGRRTIVSVPLGLWHRTRGRIELFSIAKATVPREVAKARL